MHHSSVLSDADREGTALVAKSAPARLVDGLLAALLQRILRR